MAQGLNEPVVAQIGAGAYIPKHMVWHISMLPGEFDAQLSAARLVVAHAGTGSILAAQRHGKPIILFPRRASLGEHRNEHQLATCAQLKGKDGIYVAETLDVLASLLVRTDLVAARPKDHVSSRDSFATNLRSYLAGVSPVRSVK